MRPVSWSSSIGVKPSRIGVCAPAAAIYGLDAGCGQSSPCQAVQGLPASARAHLAQKTRRRPASCRGMPRGPRRLLQNLAGRWRDPAMPTDRRQHMIHGRNRMLQARRPRGLAIRHARPPRPNLPSSRTARAGNRPCAPRTVSPGSDPAHRICVQRLVGSLALARRHDNSAMYLVQIPQIPALR